MRFAFRSLVRGARLTGAALLALAVIGGFIPARAADGPVVATADGPIRGVTGDGMVSFLGIPYAQPPVGALRWRPPAPVAPWSAVREARAFGNRCPQLPQLAGFNLGRSETEDCLFLNVFAPVASGRVPLPVMVWIPGGGLAGGEADAYDASKLVRSGRVIVVSINYRLGALGFLSVPDLDSEGHPFSNYGLMDQQAALRWVRANIARFGGDPANVTIFGESAGGQSVFAHLVSPESRGLFAKAIVESGPFGQGLGLRSPTLQQAEAGGKAFAERLGCPQADAACLRAVPVAKLLTTQASLVPRTIVVDGRTLVEPINAALIAGRFNRVPMVNGTNHDEYELFEAVFGPLNGSALTAEHYPAALTKAFGASAALVEQTYPVLPNANADATMAIVMTDAYFSCPTRAADGWLAKYVPLYAYEFADEAAPTYLPPTTFAYHALHTSEMQYLFPLFHGSGAVHPLSPAQQRLSDAMVAYWTRFAATGVPAAPNAPAWPRYGADETVLQLTTPRSRVTNAFAREHHCDVWSKVLGFPDVF